MLEFKVSDILLFSGAVMGKKKPVDLVYNKGNNSSSSLCMAHSLDYALVRSKIVACDRGVNAHVDKSLVVRDAEHGGLSHLVGRRILGRQRSTSCQEVKGPKQRSNIGDLLSESSLNSFADDPYAFD
ncbi:hypothetical protein ACFE04_022882 [Oxalis oulophora]